MAIGRRWVCRILVCRARDGRRSLRNWSHDGFAFLICVFFSAGFVVV